MASDKIAGTKVTAVVPTFNEIQELEGVVKSLVDESLTRDDIIVVNAGDALPLELSKLVKELKVSRDDYWTACVNAGFEEALKTDCDFVYLTNADTYALRGSLQNLIEIASEQTKTVACSAAYIEDDESVRLLYSHQNPMGFLLYGRLTRPWTWPEDAPSDPFPIVLTGGQGVLLPRSAVEQFRMDVKNFPQYASDHDLWLTMQEEGWKFVLVPQAGVVNTRTLSANRAAGLAKLKKLWWRMTSDMAPESWRVMWRLRRKHLSLPLAIVSTVLSFALRWTIGLPKILKRT